MSTYGQVAKEIDDILHVLSTANQVPIHHKEIRKYTGNYLGAIGRLQDGRILVYTENLFQMHLEKHNNSSMRTLMGLIFLTLDELNSTVKNVNNRKQPILPDGHVCSAQIEHINILSDSHFYIKRLEYLSLCLKSKWFDRSLLTKPLPRAVFTSSSTNL